MSLSLTTGVVQCFSPDLRLTRCELRGEEHCTCAQTFGKGGQTVQVCSSCVSHAIEDPGFTATPKELFEEKEKNFDQNAEKAFQAKCQNLSNCEMSFGFVCFALFDTGVREEMLFSCMWRTLLQGPCQGDPPAGTVLGRHSCRHSACGFPAGA